ncbi:MAG: DNA polymerase-4 [Parasphingorhabdus sp.]|jgi:DNA polymerase-4
MIIHVDMDAFYASVEEREDPGLKGKPLVVAGNPDSRGVVSAANYAAREFGVSSAMPTSIALRRCRHLIILPVRMKLYASVSQQIREIFERYTPQIEPLSIDEAFLDPSGGEKLYGSAIATAELIKNDIKRELNLVASVGVAPNKFLAKLASDHEKPDGFTVVQANQIQDFLDPMPVGRLWGVGPRSRQKLEAIGFNNVVDLRRGGEDKLVRLFGSHGSHLWNLAHGRDERKVITEYDAKSISHETTFAKDFENWSDLNPVLMQLTEAVCIRLRKKAIKGRTITLKIRSSEFKTKTVAKTLSNPTASTSLVWQVVQSLLEPLKQKPFPVRLVGVGLSHFDEDSPQQTDLFEQGRQKERTKLDSISDSIRSKFGDAAIGRGTKYK